MKSSSTRPTRRRWKSRWLPMARFLRTQGRRKRKRSDLRLIGDRECVPARQVWPALRQEGPRLAHQRASWVKQPAAYTQTPNGGGYCTFPVTPVSAPGTSSTAMNESVPENGEAKSAVSFGENPNRG